MKGALCAVLAATVLLTGCASTQPTGGAAAGGSPGTITTKPVEGVAIVKSDGLYVYYRNKCESCGHVEGKVQRMLGPSKGKAIISAFLCAKCGKAQKITIMGD